jgi:hypothetical protein
MLGPIDSLMPKPPTPKPKPPEGSGGALGGKEGGI